MSAQIPAGKDEEEKDDQMISFTMNQFHHWMSFIMGKYWMLSEKISNQIAALNNILHNELSCC